MVTRAQKPKGVAEGGSVLDWQHDGLFWDSMLWPTAGRSRQAATFWPPTSPRQSATERADRQGGRRRGGDERTSPLDLQLVDIICGAVAQECRCTRCGRPLSRSLRTEVSEPLLVEGSWTASVSSRCRGLGRHRNEARVWLSGGARCTSRRLRCREAAGPGCSSCSGLVPSPRTNGDGVRR